MFKTTGYELFSANIGVEIEATHHDTKFDFEVLPNMGTGMSFTVRDGKATPPHATLIKARQRNFFPKLLPGALNMNTSDADRERNKKRSSKRKLAAMWSPFLETPPSEFERPINVGRRDGR